jgi:hypothetical protein
MKRFFLLTALMSLAACSAVAIADVNPFDDPYTGPGSDGSQVGFRIKKHVAGHTQVRDFEFDSVVADCDDGQQFLGDKIDKTSLSPHPQYRGIVENNKFHIRDAAGKSNPHANISVAGHIHSGSPPPVSGTLSLSGKWKGHGACKADINWSATKLPG